MGTVSFASGDLAASIGELFSIFAFVGLMLLVAAPFLAPFAIAALFLIHRFSNGGWPVYALSGALVAPLGMALWVVLDDGWPAFPGAFAMGLLFAPAGALAALTYRWLAPSPRTAAAP